MTGRADRPYDVAIVGAGVVGAALARELAGRGLDIVVIDAADDVGAVTSKANTAILHTGFDAMPGSLESLLVARGHALLSSYADRAGIAVERTGALLVAWDDEQLAALPVLAEKAAANGYDETSVVDAAEVYRREPALGEGARGGLVVPDESIVCPWSTPLAFATEAVSAGVELRLGERLEGVHPWSATSAPDDTTTDGWLHELTTSRGRLRSRWLVNAAGLGSDQVDRMLGHDDFTIRPRRGELVVFDKLARSLVNGIVLPVPTARGKGVLVAPTVYGNVLLGPTADDVDDRTDTATTHDGLASLRERGRRILPRLLEEEVTAVYAGLRAATDQSDYVVRSHPEQRYLCLAGIRSTGLTASMALAEHAVELLRTAGLVVGPRREVPVPAMPPLGEAQLRPYADASRIGADPAYGTLVCHCERVSAGEIRDALESPLPPAGLDGLRRRTRAANGRCQGFFCGADVRARFEASV